MDNTQTIRIPKQIKQGNKWVKIDKNKIDPSRLAKCISYQTKSRKPKLKKGDYVLNIAHSEKPPSISYINRIHPTRPTPPRTQPTPLRLDQKGPEGREIKHKSISTQTGIPDRRQNRRDLQVQTDFRRLREATGQSTEEEQPAPPKESKRAPREPTPREEFMGEPPTPKDYHRGSPRYADESPDQSPDQMGLLRRGPKPGVSKDKARIDKYVEVAGIPPDQNAMRIISSYTAPQYRKYLDQLVDGYRISRFTQVVDRPPTAQEVSRIKSYKAGPEGDKEFNDFLTLISAQHGKGKPSQITSQNKQFKGLYEDEIIKMMRTVPQFKGVYARDEIGSFHPPQNQSWGIIMNMSPRSQPGTHWVAIINNVPDKYIGYYDSLMNSKGHEKGDNPPKDILEQMKRLVKESRLDYIPKFKYNVRPDQYIDTNTCGFHAMSVIIDILNRKKQWDIATGHGQANGEGSIIPLAHKFGYLI